MPVQWNDLRAKIRDLEIRLARAEQAKAEAEIERERSAKAAMHYMAVALSCKALAAGCIGYRQSAGYRVPGWLDQLIAVHEEAMGGPAK